MTNACDPQPGCNADAAVGLKNGTAWQEHLTETSEQDAESRQSRLNSS